MDGSTNKQASERAALNSALKPGESTEYSQVPHKPLKGLVSKAFNRIAFRVASSIHRWQQRVSIKTRNIVVLAILGGIFLYGVILLLSLLYSF